MNKKEQTIAINALKEFFKGAVHTEVSSAVEFQMGSTSYGAFTPQDGGLETTKITFTIQRIIHNKSSLPLK